MPEPLDPTAPAPTGRPAARGRGDALWLAGLCASRLFLTLVFVSYPAVLPVVQKAWGMSAAAAGSISSAFQIGFALSLVGFSSLADWVGAKRVYLWSSLAAVPAAFAFALFSNGHLSAFLLNGLLALSLGGIYTPGLIMIADRFPPATRGRATGFFLAASSSGYAASLLLTGAVLGRWGWRPALLAAATGPLVGALIALGVLRGTPNRIPPRPAGAGFTGEVLRNRPAALMIAGYTFHSWELLGMFAWAPATVAAALASRGAGELRATGLGANLAALFHLAGLLASSIGGQLSDRFGRTAVILAMLWASAACSFTFGWLVEGPLWLLLLVGLLYGFTAIGDSPVFSVGLTEVVRPHVLGAAFGVRSLLGFGAGAIAPLAFGAVLDLTNAGAPYRVWGWAYTLLGLGALGAIATMLWLRRLPESRRLAGGLR